MKTMLALAVLLVGVVQISQGAALPALEPCSLGLVNCFVAPCQVAQCSVTGALCVNDYCGGCNARWYAGDKEVTSQCVAAEA